MANTNAPPIRIPQAFMRDPELQGYTQELHSFLYLLWKRTGGGSDLIEEAQLDVDGINAAITEINGLIEGLNGLSAEMGRLRAELQRIDDLEALAYGG